MEGLREAIVIFILVYLPAMTANGSPVAVLRRRRGHPIDFGRVWRDGRRILGDGKTFEGFMIGVATALLTGVVVGLPVASFYGFTDPARVLITAFTSGVGAMLGDVVKSFFKRRVGLERGANLPVADQLDFYLGATLMVYACSPCLKPSPELAVAGSVLVLILHRAANILAYRLGWKDRPW